VLLTVSFYSGVAVRSFTDNHSTVGLQYVVLLRVSFYSVVAVRSVTDSNILQWGWSTLCY
jgi:hypothetical protein